MKRKHRVIVAAGISLAAVFAGTALGADETTVKPEAHSQLEWRSQMAERASRTPYARLGTADLEERVAEIKRLEAERIAAEKAAEAKRKAEAAKKAAAAQKAKVAQQKSSTKAPSVSSGSVWDRLAKCESGGNWSINTGNGYYGGLQFSLSSWRGVGGSGYPHQASRAEQIKRAEILKSRGGWGHWPACSKKLGLR